MKKTTKKKKLLESHPKYKKALKLLIGSLSKKNLRRYFGKILIKREGAVCGIYAFINPLTEDVIYIGASLDIYKRFDAHLKAIKDRTHEIPIMSWVDKNGGLLPTLEILEECKPSELNDLEDKFIKDGRELGWPLLNTLDYSCYPKDKLTEALKAEVKRMWRNIFGEDYPS